jgi:hypothetical protein
MIQLMQSVVFGAWWLAMGFLPGVFADQAIATLGANIAASQPVSTSTYYLPLVTSHLRQAPGDYRDCRLGVGVTRNPLATYDISPFKTGWYVDWWARIMPGSWTYSGVEYVQTVRISQDRGPNGEYLSTYQIWPALNFGHGSLGPIVQANPGSVWLIGNEPDSTRQDNIMPDMYARIYHDAYNFIKSIDPTAKVANAALIQPTPLRLLYLDMVLAAYRAQFSSPMPVDVWNMHFYIIREVKGDWGGDFPPGIDAPIGREYTLRDHVDVSIFQSLVIDFRTWLQRNGYVDKPLIVTEWGVLMPFWFLSNEGVTEADVNNFLRDAVQFMEGVSDPALGYSADSFRLVQRQAIYSLDDDTTFDDGFDRWGSYLMRSTPPYTITSVGAFYRDQIAAGRQPVVDLLPHRVASVPERLISAGEPISPVIKVAIANAGNTPPVSWPSVRFYDVTGGQRVQIGQEVFAAPVTGCGAQTQVSFVWPGLTPGLHLLSVEVNSTGDIAEASLVNNQKEFQIYVFTQSIYLPMIAR